MEVDVISVEKLADALSADIRGRDQEIADGLKPFQPGEMWAYAPTAEKQRAERAIADTIDTRQGERLFELEHALQALEAPLAARIAAESRAPDMETTFLARTKQAGMSQSDWLQLYTLQELQLTRLDRTLAGAKPSALLAAYERASADDSTSLAGSLFAAATIHHIESAPIHTGKLDTAEVTALGKLQERIKAAQESRVTEATRAAQQALQRAARVARDAKLIYRVRAQRPSLKAVS